MSARLHIRNEYPADWPQIGDRVRAEAGHRCIRCGHKYETGQHGKGEWSPCDDECTHGGPLAILFSSGRLRLIDDPGEVAADLVQRRCNLSGIVVAQWRILTVHHLDGDKANCAWWNLLSLCQRCHLQIQTRLNPELPYFLEHSDWFKPYAAGFYAKKYEGRDITREEAMARLDELLAHERLA